MLTQEQINSLTLRFQENEWNWLQSLPADTKKILAGGNEADFDATSFTHYGEFFLTLTGIKPCLLITNCDYPKFAQELYFHAIHPLENELQGFELFRLSQTCNAPVYIFTSRHHPKFPLIHEVLMKPHHQPVPNELLGKALGYPVPCGLSMVSYVDVTTSQIVFEFPARAGFEHTIKMHFNKCAEEFKKLGRVLTISCH